MCSNAGLRFILFWHLVVVPHLFYGFFYYFYLKFFISKFSVFSCICNLHFYQYGLAMTFVLRGPLFPGLALQQPVDSYETSLSSAWLGSAASWGVNFERLSSDYPHL